ALPISSPLHRHDLPQRLCHLRRRLSGGCVYQQRAVVRSPSARFVECPGQCVYRRCAGIYRHAIPRIQAVRTARLAAGKAVYLPAIIRPLPHSPPLKGLPRRVGKPPSASVAAATEGGLWRRSKLSVISLQLSDREREK